MALYSPSSAVASDVVEPDALLEISGLTIAFPRLSGMAYAANRVSLRVGRGRVLGLVGESGSGKSVTLRGVLDLVPYPGETISGGVSFAGSDLRAASSKAMEELRGREIAMVFQDPAASLNPVMRVGDQIAEIVRVKLGTSRRDAHARAVELLDRVGIASPRSRARDYPHQLSGGMRQRVMIAMAVACGPRLLLADEPTTALDVTIQDQILELLLELQEAAGMAVILVSHDLGVIAQVCDDIAVMYAGYVVERGTRDEILRSPAHPYTQALLASELRMTPRAGSSRLSTIGGQPPDLSRLPAGCPFQARCRWAREQCASVTMALEPTAGGQLSACPIAR